MTLAVWLVTGLKSSGLDGLSIVVGEPRSIWQHRFDCGDDESTRSRHRPACINVFYNSVRRHLALRFPFPQFAQLLDQKLKGDPLIGDATFVKGLKCIDQHIPIVGKPALGISKSKASSYWRRVIELSDNRVLKDLTVGIGIDDLR